MNIHQFAGGYEPSVPYLAALESLIQARPTTSYNKTPPSLDLGREAFNYLRVEYGDLTAALVSAVFAAAFLPGGGKFELNSNTSKSQMFKTYESFSAGFVLAAMLTMLNPTKGEEIVRIKDTLSPPAPIYGAKDRFKGLHGLIEEVSKNPGYMLNKFRTYPDNTDLRTFMDTWAKNLGL
jgi:hypothetical protein